MGPCVGWKKENASVLHEMQESNMGKEETMIDFVFLVFTFLLFILMFVNQFLIGMEIQAIREILEKEKKDDRSTG